MALKLIVAIIRPDHVDEVRAALAGTEVAGMTLSEVHGYGRQTGHMETYRGSEYSVGFSPKLKVELLVPEAEAEQVADVIVAAARTDKVGDGKVWVVGIDQAQRIRTGERDIAAV